MDAFYGRILEMNGSVPSGTGQQIGFEPGQVLTWGIIRYYGNGSFFTVARLIDGRQLVVLGDEQTVKQRKQLKDIRKSLEKPWLNKGDRYSIRWDGEQYRNQPAPLFAPCN